MSVTRRLLKCTENIEKFNLKLNAITSQTSLTNLLEQANSSDSRWKNNTQKSEIDGKIFTVKENICTRELKTTCASRILENYQSPFNATVVELLEKAGAILLGKTNMDEFGMGSSTTNSIFGTTLNPVDPKSSVGGSSGGSACAVAADFCDFSLGSDTGGSVRLPAAFCNLFGFKPTYGAISRYGLVSYASSLDTIGIVSKDLELLTKVFKQVSMVDENDSTSTQIENSDSKSKDKFIIGVPLQDLPKEYNRTELELTLQVLNFRDVSFASLKDSLSAYYIIASSEASSNLARYDGIRFGEFSNTISETRTNYLSDKVKQRIAFGALMSSTDGYSKACSIRSRIISEFDMIFEHCDLFVLPTFNRIPLVGESDQVNEWINDLFTVPASLAGIPVISVPISRSLSLQFMAPRGKDFELLSNVGRILENMATLKVSIPE